MAAHAVLFGGEHEMGGHFHSAIVTAACVACGGLLVAFGALAWSGAASAADGSILGARLAGLLPGVVPLAFSSGLFFAAAELLEPHHAASASPLLMAAAIAAVSWLVRALAGSLVACLARAVLAIARTPFATRRPLFVRCFAPVPAVQPAPHRRRRFARPPPR